MGKFLSGVLLPLLLLTATLQNRGLISLFDLLAFLFIQFSAPTIGSQPQSQSRVTWYILVISILAVLSHATLHIAWAVDGDQWSSANTWWNKLIGFGREESIGSSSEIYFLTAQTLAAVVALLEISGSHLRVLYCLLLPALQLVLGISCPSWTSLPFFICSCIGLVDWSLTSNFLGLFRCWKYLLLYAATNILFLYTYQLPFEFPEKFIWFANCIGLYKLSSKLEWLKMCSTISLLSFYHMLSWIRCDLTEMSVTMSSQECNLTKQLLPPKHSFFVHESRSGVRHTNVLLRGGVFRIFSINFFTYGFPISLLALSFWSFHFASLCAFGLLGYVGYILCAFPSVFHLHRLNGLLLVFILFWAASTYVFNIAFSVLNKELQKDVEIWETIGLWHYPIPGFYLLAQFCLGILVAIGNLVNNSVFLYLSEGNRQPSNYNSTIEETEETKVLIVATIAWVLRKSSRAVVLSLVLLIAMKPGLLHALYITYFMIYLLGHSVSKSLRQSLVLLCEAHFALLYILQFNLVFKALKQEGSLSASVLSVLGLLDQANSWDFLKIAALACFCTVHNHGFEMLFSFSTIVQHTPCPPAGFGILKAGLSKSVLLSVYTSSSWKTLVNNSHERRIAMFLNAMEHKFLSTYRSCGTYISFLTILFTVYLVAPNYASSGYLLFLLLWMGGRQVIEMTKKPLWFPLKLYAAGVFLFIYCLSVFPSFQNWLSKLADLTYNFGYHSEASVLENVWEPLAILIVMQLYSYERRQSKYVKAGYHDAQQIGGFKRLLILHSDKILLVALLYASLSPISAFGFLYLLGLVICSALPKSYRIPSKLLLIYSGILLMAKYLFQLWGHKVEMLPGQRQSYFAFVIGLQLFEQGFLGLESGLRGEILVIVSCILQYNVFHWSDNMPGKAADIGKWEEPCRLFKSVDETPNEFSIHVKESTSPLSVKQQGYMQNSWTSFNGSISLGQAPGGSVSINMGKNLYTSFWESSKESSKWNKRRTFVMRKERLEMQKTMLKICIKFWIENIFNLFGLEINMLGLLLASFAVLNAISLLYISALVACILLHRHVIQKLWPMFVFLFASVLTLEYMSIWWNLISSEQHASSEAQVSCHECWRISDKYFQHCKKCWLGTSQSFRTLCIHRGTYFYSSVVTFVVVIFAGIIVDDPRMLISYYMVFMLACFKFRSDKLSWLPGLHTFKEIVSGSSHASVLSDLSFETKSLWTFLDYLWLYSYCHLLDLVLALILITGTLEYDVLHLGYLGFAIIFFRVRLEILKKKNKIFKFLRIYNFALIVLSLAYQSPFVGYLSEGKSDTTNYISDIIGFYKFDYGFRITSRSALVEIIMFILVSLQSYMFSSQNFDYVCKYLQAEQIGAIVREQEKRAAWKTEQLQHIRKTEEQKRLRNLQVEKMKFEVLNLQIQTQLHGMNSNENNYEFSPTYGGLRRRRRRNSFPNLHGESSNSDNHESVFVMPNKCSSSISLPLDRNELSKRVGLGSPSGVEVTKMSIDSLPGIMEIKDNSSSDDPNSKRRDNVKTPGRKNSFISAVSLIGDGVSQVRSLGNRAVTSLVNILNIQHVVDESENSSDDEEYYEIESLYIGDEQPDQTFSLQSNGERIVSDTACQQIGMILQYIWGQMRSNNDVVCYCCFVLIFLWNFSLLSMVYLGALYLYALCVNTGPGYFFWLIMLIYTEVCILLQYLYQIIIQHSRYDIQISLLQELGFPEHRIESSFVISNLPLFLVYLFTLLQTSIMTRDDDWSTVAEYSSLKRSLSLDKVTPMSFGFRERIIDALLPLMHMIKLMIRSLCRYWTSLTRDAETPPYFVQLSMEVSAWPEDGIQPERIESGINKLLNIVHERRCKDMNLSHYPSVSRVRIQSIEQSPDSNNICLAVFEVAYAAPLTESTPADWHKSLTPATDVATEILEAKRSRVLKEIRFPYPILSVIGGGKRDMDLYAYIFCADLVVFFLVAMFYESVIKNNSEFLEVYQLEDQFPKEFVFLLMIIFSLIVLDRIIYLCSFTTGKVMFYLFNLVLFTLSVTNYAWDMEPTQRRGGGFALRAIYLTKAISLAFQAIQMKYGFPHKSTFYRQFLTSSVSQINYLAFRLYRALPFLYELRCVLDWSCTATSLTMYDWLKLEDIYSSLFLVKCDADLNRSKHQQGQRQSKLTKFCNGICLFFVLVCVIWAPMLMYSSGNPTNIANPIKDVQVRIDIKTVSGKLTLYETTLCEKFSWAEVHAHVNPDPEGYLSAYNEDDIQLICCQADASTRWLVPPVVVGRFIPSVEGNMEIVFSWQFARDRPKGKEIVKYEVALGSKDLPKPQEVVEVLNGTADSFRIHNVYPRYFRVTGSGDVRFVEQEVNLVTGDLVFNRGYSEWWTFHDIDASNVSGCGDIAGPMAVIVSEETPRKSHDFISMLDMFDAGLCRSSCCCDRNNRKEGILGDTLSKFSIWSLYITFVLAVGRFIRLQCSDLRMRIPFENLPSCDRLLAICEDIYAARAKGELEVEEILYWTLVKIYRSPHVLLEYTKPD